MTLSSETMQVVGKYRYEVQIGQQARVFRLRQGSEKTVLLWCIR
jgi:hypothetical protein